MMMKDKQTFVTQWIVNSFMSACALTVLGACSTIQPPVEKASQAELAVREASEKQAPQYAPLELRQARDKLEAARQAMKEENYVTARRLAEQALVDAQLAQEKAEAEIVRQNVLELQKSLDVLRTEMSRQSER